MTRLEDSKERYEKLCNKSVGDPQVTVNSGGVVYFALFQNSHMGDAKQKPEESENASEAAAVFKFASSRLATQSECLGFELARHLGVGTPQVRAYTHNHSLSFKLFLGEPRHETLTLNPVLRQM